ncbi:18S rRNA pseudouridine methyltransferase [Tilletia horrida]|nr:18S rRNA pseudouridine methyltransferase [Tilletia horrida]KAK0569940.1 18S rRNA pseudouridine methyltransferase [Tilletia horrida]
MSSDTDMDSVYGSSGNESGPAKSSVSAPASTRYRSAGPDLGFLDDDDDHVGPSHHPRPSTSHSTHHPSSSFRNGGSSSIANNNNLNAGGGAGSEHSGRKTVVSFANQTTGTNVSSPSGGGALRHALPPKPATSFAPNNAARYANNNAAAGPSGTRAGGAGTTLSAPASTNTSTTNLVAGSSDGGAAAGSNSAQKRVRIDASLVPQAPKVPKTTTEKESTPRLIVVLAQACLETYKISSGSSSGPSRGGYGGGGGYGGPGGSRSSSSKDGGDKYALLNCDDHQRVLAKMGRDIAEARPDITHQCLLTLLDSPLNKAGFLQVYIHTARGVLIEVNPHVRIPRTFKRFSGLMVQLLHKLSIRSVKGSEKLLRVIKNPVTDHFPPNTHKITLSYDAPVQRLSQYLPTVPANHSIAVFVGAMAHGQDSFADDVVDEKISISEYSLSASVACGKEVLKQTAALLAPLSAQSDNARTWLLRLDQIANAHAPKTVVVGSQLSGTASLLPTLLDEPLRGDSLAAQYSAEAHDQKLILDPTLDPQTFSALYNAERIIFITDAFTLASASTSSARSKPLSLDVGTKEDPTLYLLKYFSAKPGTQVLINHLDDAKGGIASETQDLQLLSSALGSSTIDSLVRSQIATASDYAHPKLPVSSINIGAAVRANAALREALASSGSSSSDAASSSSKAALWDQFTKLYESSALGSVRGLLLPPPSTSFDSTGGTRSEATVLFSLQHALSDLLSLCAKRQLRVEAVDGVVGLLDEEVDGLARRMVEDALEAGKSAGSLVGAAGRRRAGGIIVLSQEIGGEAIVSPPAPPAPADVNAHAEAKQQSSTSARLGSFWTAMVSAVRSDPVLRSDRSRSLESQATDSRSTPSSSALEDVEVGGSVQERHVLPSLTDRRRAGAVEEAFRGRLALWKLLLLGRSDEVGLVLEQAVSRSFAKEEEEKLIFQAGRLDHLASETVERTDALINSALTSSTQPARSLEGAGDEVTGASATNNLTASALSVILSPTQLNATRAGLPTHHTHRYVLNDPYVLARPIAKRRAQLLGSRESKGGSVIDALAARTQKAVLRTYLLLVPAGILAGGPYLSRFLLGSGTGTGASSASSAGTSGTTVAAAAEQASHTMSWSATSALEYLASLDPHTALPLSAILTLSSIYMLQSSYTKAKRRFWKDWDALAHNLASDVEANAQEVVRAHVGQQREASRPTA